MFEDGHAGSLIDEIGDAARDESAAIARRLAAVGELDALRTVELVERRLWRTDPFEEVAAEISAAQNISRGRAGGQIHMARVLRDELPEVAEVFATGAIDYRMVATIISRTDNVEPDRKAAVDAAIARHCVKWMRLSGPKLATGWICGWPSMIPTRCECRPTSKTTGSSTSARSVAGMAGIYGHLESPDAALLDATLDALAATVCDNDPRTKEQRRADALGPLARRESTLACRCGSADCAAVARAASAERRS